MKMSVLGRILLLITGLLAAYQIAFGLDGLPTAVTIAYTVAFGVLLVAGLLLIILGFEVLDTPAVVIVSTLIPLSLATGLIWEYNPSFRIFYLIFAIIGILAVSVTRIIPTPGKLPIILLAVVHGLAGMTIFVLPINLSISGEAAPGFALVGVGGAFIGVGGLLLAFLKSGRPVLSKKLILTVLPGLLLLMTLSFVAGFKFG
jgi:hypothetical protein